MTFLVLLLALALEKFSGWRRRIQRDGAWLAWLGLVEDLPSVSRRSWLGLLLAVVLPLLPLALLLTLLQPLAYGWLSLPLHLLVVVYSLGRGDVMADLGPFRDAWRREEAQAAFHVAERDLGILGGSESELIGRVHGHLLWQGYQSFFAVIFWYALLGPVAALAYRLLALALEHARQPALREQAARVRHILDWLPVRALVLSFALVGNFLAVIRVLLHWLLAWTSRRPRCWARPDGSPAMSKRSNWVPPASPAWMRSGNCWCARPCSGTPCSPSARCSSERSDGESACDSPLTLSYRTPGRYRVHR